MIGSKFNSEGIMDKPQLNSQQLKDVITLAITPAVTESGCYLEEITITPVGKSRLMTIIVDSDSHLNLDQVTGVSRKISEVLDVLPELGDSPFTLEVSSPGIDRPLTQLRHWRKNHGRLVKAAMNDGSIALGRIGDVDGEAVFIGETKFPVAEIKKAHIEIEFKSLKSEDSE